MRTVIQGLHRCKFFAVQSQLGLIKGPFALEDKFVDTLPNGGETVGKFAGNDVRNCTSVGDEQHVQSAIVHFFRLSPAGQVTEKSDLLYVIYGGLYQFDNTV